MNDETTRLINEDMADNKESNKENNTQQSVKMNQKDNAQTKTSGKVKVGAAVAGGFVAGAAVGAATTAAASSSEEIPETNKAEETVETPEPDAAILANDEGIRYAHVNADNFSDAFAQAREQVGPGGVFEYNGKIYATYTEEEWNGMSQQERTDYQGKIFDTLPSHNSTQAANTASATVDNTVVEQNYSHEMTTDQGLATPVNAEMISPEPADSDIKVLGVEAVQTPEGQIMNVALVENNGDHALLVDVDNSGTIDVLIHDDNVDGMIQENEVYDISGAGIEVADLEQAQIANDSNPYYASVDDNMVDYCNDADMTMNV